MLSKLVGFLLDKTRDISIELCFVIWMKSTPLSSSLSKSVIIEFSPIFLLVIAKNGSFQSFSQSVSRVLGALRYFHCRHRFASTQLDYLLHAHVLHTADYGTLLVHFGMCCKKCLCCSWWDIRLMWMAISFSAERAPTVASAGLTGCWRKLRCSPKCHGVTQTGSRRR